MEKNINESALQNAFEQLNPIQLMRMVNGLIELMYEKGADVIDFDNDDYRIEKLYYSKEDDEIYFSWAWRENK